MTDWKNRITVDPDILVGKPIIKGTRISVERIMDRFADGGTMEQILESYPDIAREDVLAAIVFVTDNLFCGEDHTATGKAEA